MREQFEMAPVWGDPAVHGWHAEGAALGVDPAELPELYEEANAYLRQQGQSSHIPLDTAEHERQHLDAMREVAVSRRETLDVKIGLVVVRHVGLTALRLERRFSVLPFASCENDNLNPIEAASILGHPDNPSPTDIRGLKKMGYPDVRTLGETIVHYNRESGAELPLPRSYE